MSAVSKDRGFTLIEILIVIGMLAVLATVVLVAVNPLRQFAQARNSQRQANVSAILNAVSNRIADNRGILNGVDCSVNIPEEGQYIATSDTAGDTVDLRPCLVPAYISDLPYDPEIGSNKCTSDTCNGEGEIYNTGYKIAQDPTTSRITVCAEEAAEEALPDSKPFCLTR